MSTIDAGFEGAQVINIEKLGTDLEAVLNDETAVGICPKSDPDNASVTVWAKQRGTTPETAWIDREFFVPVHGGPGQSADELRRRLAA